MFLSCSYFFRDFSLDVLIKGVLIKKGVIEKATKITANTFLPITIENRLHDQNDLNG